MRLLLPWVLGLGACLPAYDNHVGGLVQGDMAGGDMTSTTNPCTTASAKKILATPFLMNKVMSVQSGPVLRIEGCTGEPGTPGVSKEAASSFMSTTIPTAYADTSVPRYLIVEGTWKIGTETGNVLRNWIAPRIPMDGGARLQQTTLHLSTDMAGVRAQIAKELSTAGKIAAADGAEAEFAKHYTFAYGSLTFPSMITVNEAQKTSFSIDDDTSRDKASCDPKSTCCIYYANPFDAFFGGTASSLLLVTSPPTNSASGFFAVVCHEEGDGGADGPDITLKMTATSITDKTSGKNIAATVDSPFPAFKIPRKRGEAVGIEYEAAMAL